MTDTFMEPPESPAGQMRRVLAVNRALQNEKRALDRLARLKRDLLRAVEEINEVAATKYTGWFALMKRDGSGWKCVGCFNPDISADEVEPEWDIALPIPDPTTVPEFKGW